MKYLCLIYHREQVLDALPQREYDALVSATLAHYEALRQQGCGLASHALTSVQAATTIRVRDGKRIIGDGAFAETPEQLGGYLLIEASDLDEAIRLAAEHPMACFGSIEIRPIRELPP